MFSVSYSAEAGGGGGGSSPLAGTVIADPGAAGARGSTLGEVDVGAAGPAVHPPPPVQPVAGCPAAASPVGR